MMKEKEASVSFSEQREKADHGDIFLPVNSYHCIVPDTYTELSVHWHEEMEITLIREGLSEYRVGQEVFQAEKDDLILVPPFTLHSAMEIPGQEMISDSLVFHLDYLGASGQDLSASRYLRPLAQGHLRMPVRLHREQPGYQEIAEAFHDALLCFQEKKAYYELALKERLLKILVLLFQGGYVSLAQISGTEKESRKQFQDVLRYIGDHYQEPISISNLAGLSGFSESYFMSIFKQNAGMSCVKYINAYRIQKAAEALENSAQPVMEIALDHGFDNISYFNLQFRRRFGMTPREFRAHRRQETTA